MIIPSFSLLFRWCDKKKQKVQPIRIQGPRAAPKGAKNRALASIQIDKKIPLDRPTLSIDQGNWSVSVWQWSARAYNSVFSSSSSFLNFNARDELCVSSINFSLHYDVDELFTFSWRIFLLSARTPSDERRQIKDACRWTTLPCFRSSFPLHAGSNQ